MSIVSLKEITQDARKRAYAVPMFDVSNTTMIRAAVEVAEETESPVILAAFEPDITGSLLTYWSLAAQYAALHSKVPVCIHLDHAASLDLVLRCADHGFTGVMLDASVYDFEENIARTKEVCDAVRKRGISVEAELGHVGSGSAGSGDESGRGISADSALTEPDSVAEFIDRTSCDALAVSIGTAHGVYSFTPKLDIERLREINQRSSVPLVLHGGSGTPEDQLRAAIENGIAKINIYSEICRAWNTAMLAKLQETNNLSDWFSKFHAEPEKAMREAMRRKITLFGSAGKA